MALHSSSMSLHVCACVRERAKEFVWCALVWGKVRVCTYVYLCVLVYMSRLICTCVLCVCVVRTC